MKSKKIRGKKGPEALIQMNIIKMLRNKGWFVQPMVGNAYQQGIPDLYCTHFRYGARWVEVKRPNMEGSKFTPAQLEKFPQYCAAGAGVWILVAATDSEYQKLFTRHNWAAYLLMKL